MNSLKFGPLDVQPGQVVTAIVRPTQIFTGQRFRCSDEVAEAFDVLSIRVAYFEHLVRSIRMRDLRGARLKLDPVRPDECMTIRVRNVGRVPARFACELE